MPQLSLYLTDEEMENLRESAARAGVSMSKYAAQAIVEKKKGQQWPAGFFDLYGSIDDPSFTAPDDSSLDSSLDDSCNWFEDDADVPA